MTKYFYITLFIISLSFCEEEKSAQDIILGSIYRLEGYNHELSMDVSVTNTKKKNKVENVSYKISVIWNPEHSEAFKLGRIDELSSDDGLIAWFHEYADKTMKRWVFLKDLNILKEIKNNKANGKIDISAFALTNDILSEELTILGTGDINGISCTVIEVKFKSGEIVKIWIDKDNAILHRKEYYTHSKKMYKVVSFDNIAEEGGIKYYKTGKMSDIKKNIDTVLEIKDLKKIEQYNIDFFLPKKGE